MYPIPTTHKLHRPRRFNSPEINRSRCRDFPAIQHELQRGNYDLDEAAEEEDYEDYKKYFGDDCCAISHARKSCQKDLFSSKPVEQVPWTDDWCQGSWKTLDSEENFGNKVVHLMIVKSHNHNKSCALHHFSSTCGTE